MASRPWWNGPKQDMDAGRVPAEDCGQRGYTEYPTEAYAQLFAFMSLIDPAPAARADYAQRARTLLMHIMNAAALGPAATRTYFCPGDPETAVYPPFRDPIFFTEDSDRLRWYGEAFPLTVDWIYDTLTVADKATINTVFTRWGNEIIQHGYHHPEPIGVTNDPGADRRPPASALGGQQLLYRPHAQPGHDVARAGRRRRQPRPAGLSGQRHRRLALPLRRGHAQRCARRPVARGLRVQPPDGQLRPAIPARPAHRRAR